MDKGSICWVVMFCVKSQREKCISGFRVSEAGLRLCYETGLTKHNCSDTGLQLCMSVSGTFTRGQGVSSRQEWHKSSVSGATEACSAHSIWWWNRHQSVSDGHPTRRNLTSCVSKQRVSEMMGTLHFFYSAHTESAVPCQFLLIDSSYPHFFKHFRTLKKLLTTGPPCSDSRKSKQVKNYNSVLSAHSHIHESPAYRLHVECGWCMRSCPLEFVRILEAEILTSWTNLWKSPEYIEYSSWVFKK